MEAKALWILNMPLDIKYNVIQYHILEDSDSDFSFLVPH
jgi:hypothetical protein